ncbi:late embryogenesis abundant protein 47-like [Lycium ferocissimum]|uniref:late embryogenesis abundant protein 47-like n=1 Tax=Lycium ferocissimum TaxID=112874 RepID=UPI00281634B7|nr:late embryogenesis abundant protein 47-like [Lycium ferocissimum]
MSQEQPRREEAEEEHASVKQEDVVDVQGSLARKRAVAESIGGQVLGKDRKQPSSESVSARANITIGEALEATVVTAGNRPVDYSDAAAIQAAEVRATGRTNIIPGGVAAAAQSAATRNARLTKEEEKTKLAEILADASSKLPSDKPVTRKDAEGVIGAELRNDPNLCTRPGGVAASIAAAARLNQSNSTTNTTSGTKNNDKNSTNLMKQKQN